MSLETFMPVTVGARPDHGFDSPLGLLSDCHRRIERFLNVLSRVLTETGGGALDARQRHGLQSATEYFSTAAPRHTQDEEHSLFPLMRRSSDPEVAAAMARLDALEADHREAETAHTEVDQLCRCWLRVGTLTPAEAGRLGSLLRALAELYRRHIAVEDQEVFPLAGRALSAGELAAVGQEMARRRGLSVDHARASPSPTRVDQEDRL